MTPSDVDDEEELQDQWKGGDDSEDEVPAKKNRGAIKKENAVWVGTGRVFGSDNEVEENVVGVDGNGAEDGEGLANFVNGFEEPEEGF